MFLLNVYIHLMCSHIVCSLSMTVDEMTIESPFGFLFPSGPFSPHLLIGGVPHSQLDLLYAGAIWDGFKGRLQEVRVNGRVLDFTENLAASEVSLFRGDSMEGSRGQNGCDYHFGGHPSYAEFGMSVVLLPCMCMCSDLCWCV